MYEPIEIAPEPPKPELPGHVAIYPTMDEIIDAVAADMVVQAGGCVRKFGDFHLMLSGSLVLEGLYRRLMYDPSFRGLPWTRTHLWMTDEALDASGPEGPVRGPRHTLVREWIVDNTDIPGDQTHRIDLSHETPAAVYEQRLGDTLGWREKGHDRPDFVVLAVEAEGLVPLLPPDASRSSRLVHRLAAPTGEGVVFSIGPAIIRAARCVAIVASGDAGAGGLRAIGALEALEPLRPVGGELRWYLDEQATVEAAKLSRGRASG